jgi:PAS domain S-box-containing protein
VVPALVPTRERRPSSAGRPLPSLWRGAVLLAGVLLVSHLATFLVIRSPAVLDAVDQWFPAVALGLATTATLFAAWRLRAAKLRFAGAWYLLAAAYLSFTIAEFAGVAFGVTFHTGGTSQLLAGLYLAFYPLFLCGVLVLPRARETAGERAELVLDITMVVVAAGVVLWTLLLQPALTEGTASGLVLAITVGCMLGDLAILWAALTLVLRPRDNAASPIYLLLATSAGVLIVADIAWAYRVLSLTRTASVFIGPAWTASHLLAALAAVYQAGHLPDQVNGSPVATAHRRPSLASVVLAYLCLTAAWGAVVARHYEFISPVVAIATLALIVIIAARHRIGIRMNAALYRRLKEARDGLQQRVAERTVDLARTNLELEQRLKELTLVGAVAAISADARDLEDLIARTTVAIRDTLAPDSCGFLVWDSTASTLRVAPSFHYRTGSPESAPIPVGSGIAGRVAATGTLCRAGSGDDTIAGDSAMRSELCVPVSAGADGFFGVIDAKSARPDAFTPDDERIFSTVASEVGTAIERMRATAALRQSERNYRELFNATGEAIFVHDAETGAILDVNQTTLDLYGYSRDEAANLTVADLSVHRPPFTQEEADAHIRRALEEGPQGFEWCGRRKDGGEFWAEVTLRSSLIGGKRRVLAVVRDISERKRAEEALRLSEGRFRAMVQSGYDFIIVLDAGATITYATPSAGRVLGYGQAALLGLNGLELTHPDDLPAVREAFERTAHGRATGRPIEFRIRHADGSWVYIEGIGSNLLEHPSIKGIVLNAREIGERKRAEEEIQRKLKELTVVNTVAELAVKAEDDEVLIARATETVRGALYPDDCGVLLVDEEAGALRYTESYRQGLTGLNRDPIPLSSGITGSVASTGNPRREGEVTRVREYVARLAGMHSEVCVPMRLGQRVIGVVNAESSKPDAFTEHDEAVLGTIASQLATALGRLRAAAAQRESEERFRRLTEAAFEGIGITDQGRIVDANNRLAEMFGYSLPELLGRNVMEFVAPESVETVANFMRQGKGDMYEHLAIRKDGSVFPVETQGKPLSGGGTMRVAAVRDITERERAAQRIQRQLARLAALRAVDAAITGGLDLGKTLDLFLTNLLEQLHVDAADILFYEPSRGGLAFAAGKGFRSDAVRRTRLAQGECYAGRAAAERLTIAVPDLAVASNGLSRASLLVEEQFKVYFVAPLVANGHVHGVLEVFNRKPFEADREWLDFLDTLAGQVAIAIDNRRLFESLQRSNAELELAYDTTLEGWSRALELRDRETHGHTARVVDLTVRLARVMGVLPEDLVHVRRGVLLHDIGKMGIPDNILLKPGPLTEEEWEVMRQHPGFAFELLSPIGFLEPALAIPYCHHEHWDGTGYPRGLAGAAIPLVARIFAVVDAWDALRFPRPYREAWSEDLVRTYLHEEGGKRFDPTVVSAFLDLVG